jgi:hypothetical protein
MKKTCIKCLEEKDIEEFNDSSNAVPSLIGTCKSCLKTYNAAYYKAHKEQVLENQRYRRKNDRRRN